MMSGPDLAVVLGAVATVLTAATALVVALGSLRRRLGEVHTIVNQQRTDQLAYQATLIRALRAANIDVPEQPGGGRG